MELTISVGKHNVKSIILWGAYILFLLFNISLAYESYIEYEYIAGNIFAVITIVVGLAGIGLFWVRKKSAA